MHVQICRTIGCATMHDDIIKFTWCKVAKWAEYVGNHAVLSSKGVNEPLQHDKPCRYAY